jgi:hypothetical protein
MIDREGLEDIEDSVLKAIEQGLARKDSGIHPDSNSQSRPVARTPSPNHGWIEAIRKKIAELQERDGNIYPFF